MREEFNESFNIEKSFDFYLKETGLFKKDIPKEQLDEMKRAYYAGVSSLIFNIKYLFGSDKTSEEISDRLNDVVEEIRIFWVMETVKKNLN